MISNVPYLDLQAHHRPIKDELMQAIENVIDCGAFAGGSFVEQFEKDFAAYCQIDSAIGVGSGSDALWLALKALGIGPGDEVVTVPNTFFATAGSITRCGAKPVFVDVCPDTCNMDPARLFDVVTSRTKAIIPVHLFGQPADMDPIMAFAKEHGLVVVEDAAQAHGAKYKGKRAGSIGDIGCFSFYPGKNLGAFGEGGAVITRNAELDQRIRMLRDHGQARKHHHHFVGWNARMDGIQAAVLQIKLRHLDRNTELRNTHALRYTQNLKDLEAVILPRCRPEVWHAWHVFAIRVPRRDEVFAQLTDRGIGCGIHYPIPVHLQEAYRDLGYTKGSFPVAEACADELISLPMFPELSDEQIDHVSNVLRSILSEMLAS